MTEDEITRILNEEKDFKKREESKTRKTDINTQTRSITPKINRGHQHHQHLGSPKSLATPHH